VIVSGTLHSYSILGAPKHYAIQAKVALIEQLKLIPSLLSCLLCCPCSQAFSDVPDQHVVHCRQLGQIASFTGNEKDYYDPDNSCMNMVLQRRTGIPITLGLLYMVVAQRLGLSLHGLNLPGHLMVGNSIEGVTNLLVDPFDGNACRSCRCLHLCKHFWDFALESLTQALRNMGICMCKELQSTKQSHVQ